MSVEVREGGIFVALPELTPHAPYDWAGRPHMAHGSDRHSPALHKLPQ